MAQDARNTPQSPTEPEAFSRQELCRYLTMMSCKEEAAAMVDRVRQSVVGNPLDSDEIWIDVFDGQGVIKGSNGRSLLIAVYRFLREAGCRFIKPGSDGEIIPVTSLKNISVHLHERASYSCRGICLEGANSLENVTDLIDFLPKRGMNTYFIQFKKPRTFFDKWYAHNENPFAEGCALTSDEMDNFMEVMNREITKRGLVHHAVGHGWTTEMLGEAGTGWDERKAGAKMDFKFQPFVAKINGKREFHLGVPINTNLCYSSVAVQAHIAQEICDYVRTNPGVNVLHLWLADNFNNFCECENCIKKRPSDHYIHLLNVVEERLTAQGSPVKICFLAYFDLLWPPIEERLLKPGRFLLLFAPITRTYQHTFWSNGDPVLPAPFAQNSIILPKTPEEHIALLKGWQQVFDGDSIMFDYHYMWYGFFDLGDFQIAKVLCQDIENLEKLGLNGLISCQTNRSGMPSGLGQRVLMEKLWDKNVRFEDIVRRYFAEAFDKDADSVCDFLNELSLLCFPPMLREKAVPDEQIIRGFSKIQSLVESFEPLVLERMSSETGTSFRMWRLLGFVIKLAKAIAPMYIFYASGNRTATLEQWERVKIFAQRMEEDVQKDFDLCLFVVSMERALGLRPQYE